MEGHVVVKVGCGIGSSVILTREGKVFSWGSALIFSGRDLGMASCYPIRILCNNEFCWTFGLGTMDLSTADPRTPTLLRSMASHCVADVACGGAHSLLVTKDGSLPPPPESNWYLLNLNCLGLVCHITRGAVFVRVWGSRCTGARLFHRRHQDPQTNHGTCTSADSLCCCR